MQIASGRSTRWLLLAASTLAMPAWAGDYLPARLHDHAVYSGQPLETAQRSTVDRRRGDWLHFNPFAGWGPRWLSSPGDSERLYLRGDRQERQLLTNFDRAPGFTRPIEIGHCNRGDATIGARDQVLDTPAGTFEQVVRLDLTTRCADAGVTGLWFARGVGLVQWRENTLAGPQTYSLSSGVMAGASYPRPRGLVVSGEFPGTEAWINMMPVVGERPPSRIRVALALANHTDQPVSYRFATSQRYDILLLDAAGVIVARWSADKVFAQVASVLTLQPGEDIRFADLLELQTPAGDAVPEGDYRLVMRLAGPPADERVPAAQAPLRIRWAY